MAAALLHRFKPDVLEDEIRSQLRMFVHCFDRAPDFIDGHQHVHLLPQVRNAGLRLRMKRRPTHGYANAGASCHCL